MPSVVPKELSPGECEFADHCGIYGIVPAREYPFMQGRDFRFDFCFPDDLIAVEIEGGSYTNGRHNRPKGFASDCEKYNLAALMGYRIFRFTPEMVHSGSAIDFVMTVLGKPLVAVRA